MLLCDGERITTSGCPVFHPNDARSQYIYFNIASHGFITEAEVRYPFGNSRVIGIKGSVRSLCRIIDSNINYTADCFAGSNEGIMLRKLVKEEDVWLGNEFFFDGPLTGLLRDRIHIFPPTVRESFHLMRQTRPFTT